MGERLYETGRMFGTGRLFLFWQTTECSKQNLNTVWTSVDRYSDGAVIL